jgi:peroxiredoxin
MSARWLQIFCALTITALPTWAGGADEDWQAIVALDAGPQEQPRTREAAAQMVSTHLARQEKVLRAFLAEHPADERVFEGRLRLARLLEIRASFENSSKALAESKRLLDELEKTATPEQRPQLDFAKVARLMRGLHPSDSAQREAVLKAARQFQTAHPTDSRVAGLLAEVATLFDQQPTTKEALLEDARAANPDDELKSRINDDLKRVRLLGTEVPLRFTSVQGEEFNLESLRGRPVFVVFFATVSPPAVAALGQLQQEIASLPKGTVRIVGVSLDEKREPLLALLKARGLTWPVAFDGKSWESPIVRELGINALPTVWLLDARGRLRSLNALEGAAGQARQLLQKR